MPATPEFFSAVRELCDETGALMIVDEVQVRAEKKKSTQQSAPCLRAGCCFSHPRFWMAVLQLRVARQDCRERRDRLERRLRMRVAFPGFVTDVVLFGFTACLASGG